jgi:hypothetical protein
MIGNRGDASYIREWVRDEQYASDNTYTCPEWAPEGWKFLGRGCYRAAYLSPDGVVYKVQHATGLYQGQCNWAEYKRYNFLRFSHKMPEGARFPLIQCFRFSGGDDVNAMDHVGPALSRYSGGDYRTYSNCYKRVARLLGLWDSHDGNAAVDEKNKLVVPIDLG